MSIARTATPPAFVMLVERGRTLQGRPDDREPVIRIEQRPFCRFGHPSTALSSLLNVAQRYSTGWI